MSHHFLHCVHCQSDRGRAQLKIKEVSVTNIENVPLTEDGAILGHNWFHTYTVTGGKVYCAICDATHNLSDQEVVFPWTLQPGDLVEWMNPDTGTPETLELIAVRFINPGHPTEGSLEIQTEDNRFMVVLASELSEVS